MSFFELIIGACVALVGIAAGLDFFERLTRG